MDPPETPEWHEEGSGGLDQPGRQEAGVLLTPATATQGRQPRWHLGPRQRTVVISWASFTFTFALTRALTYAIKHGVGPFGFVEAGGVHLHHYLWGIQLLAASGGVAIYGNGRLRSHPVVVTAYAAGFALVVDEFALLVHLKDVYWTNKGRSSVLLGVAMIGLEGAALAGMMAWQLRQAAKA